MTETPATTIRTSFERVVQSTCGLPQYESARALVSVEETFPGTLNPDEVTAVVKNQFTHAKASVFEQLSINFAQDPETMVLRETFGDVSVVASGAPSRGGATVRALPNRPAPTSEHPAYEDDAAYGDSPYEPPSAPPPPRRVVSSRPQPQRRSGPPSGARRPAASMGNDEFWADLMANPDNWNDLRAAKESGDANPKGPDFKSKVHPDPNNSQYKVGLWLSNAPDWVEV